ncbi:heterodimeric geranylgeranyl pyrophosphate synthase small subunit, chloroplastic-like [Citrus sinensis]|uniref:heterodimeric geranylgeranyl pyrophosphate synthase small subunit, chloroplastic-like n=1 Tax=Citrus sinensis TaxID=2711 RepID=UPI00227831CB|nr:heterodimeric geranylgeranyl pyrophosphate synthase small subunit, chloroplastic-like [Citrus sinensis]
MLPPYLPTAIGSSCALAFTNQNQVTQQDAAYWTSIHEDIGAHLRQAVVVKERVEVYEPMRHFVFAAPVNMAPVLCVAACELVGGHREQAIVAAAALHVMHAASFIHANQIQSFSWRMQCFRFGLELLASSDNPAGNNSGRILRVMVEMTRAMGSQGVVEGQYNELQCSQCDEMMIGN